MFVQFISNHIHTERYYYVSIMIYVRHVQAVIMGKDAKGKGIVAEVTQPRFDDFKTPRMGGVRKSKLLIDLAVRFVFYMEHRLASVWQ